MKAVELFVEVAELLKKGVPFVMVTMISRTGSIPQDVGARLVVTQQGQFCGTIGGGALEGRCIERALTMLQEKGAVARQESWKTADLGMVCGGTVGVFFEPFCHQSWSIAVFGAGHVGQALVRLLQTLDCRIAVFDTRQEWLERIPVNSATTLHCLESLEDGVAKLSPNAFAVIASKSHDSDERLLCRILEECKLPFIGVIGSGRKAAQFRERVSSRGLDAGGFVCPVGLPFGDNDPAEIAVSIVAQLLGERDKWIGRKG